MPDEDTEALAHEPGQDAVVPVAVRAERSLRVVDVEAAEPIEADARVDLSEQPVEGGLVRDVIARRVQMAAVEAEPEAGMPTEPLDDRRELVH
jgi:hypothetical protein